MRIPNHGIRIDSPAFPLLQAGIAYWGITSVDGNALGTTLGCADLDNHPSFVGNRVKMLTGGAWGQDRLIMAHAAGGVETVDAAFTDSTGAAQQIVAGTLFVILSNPGGGGGGGGGMPPTAALWMFGIVSPAQVASTTVIDIPHLAGFQDDTFNDEFYMQILHAGGAAPEGEKHIISDYVGATGRFTTDAFSANVEAGDIVAIFHRSIEAIDIIARGTLDTSSATVPADSTRTEGNDHFNGHLFVPTEGTYVGRATRIVDYTGAGGIFTLDPNNPLPGVPGLVDYIILKSQSEFVPVADGVNNRTPADVVGNKADAATLDDMSALATATLVAEAKRILLRMSGAGIFSADIQGAARTELDTMLAQLATYISALGAAYSATVNPGGAAKDNIEQTLEDLGDVLAGAGITTFPAGAPAANGISIAEVLRYIQETLVAPTVAGKLQVAATTIDLNQAAASYDLFTATTQDVIVEKLVLRCPALAAGGALTSISIQSDDATPIVLVDNVAGAVANLTSEAQLAWTGAMLLDAGTGAKIRLTINGGAHGVAYVCDVIAEYRACVAGGYLV